MSTETERAYERAEALCDMRRFDEAISLLHQALAAEPDDADLLNLLSRALDGADRFAEALSTADRALAMEPDVEGARHVRVRSLWHLGRRAQALEAARDTVDAEPWCVRAWFDLAWMADAAGTLEEARMAAAEAVELDPDDPDAWRAAAYAGLPEEETRLLLERGLAVAPEDASLHNDLAWGLLLHGRFEEAERFSRQAIRIDPAGEIAPIALGNLATALRWQGKLEEAEEMRRRAVELATQSLDERQARDPHDAGVYISRGTALWNYGQHARAVEHFHRAVELEPENDVAWRWVATTELTLGNLDAARTALARASSIDPDSQDALYDDLELAYHERNPRRAAKAARQLAQSFGGDWLTDEGQAIAALVAGRLDEAIECSRRVLERNAIRCCSHALLAIALAHKGAHAEARAAATDRDTAWPYCDCSWVREIRELLR